jgi:cytochrome o ubiquinol oxidase operon protein cyoD
MKATLKGYIWGFILSVVLTLAAAGLVWTHGNFWGMTVPVALLVPALLVLAVIQLFVQLIFFMHLSAGSESRWRLGAFISTAGIILIVIIGSIWIMNHLNYNMMASPSEMNAYIQSQDGL